MALIRPDQTESKSLPNDGRSKLLRKTSSEGEESKRSPESRKYVTSSDLRTFEKRILQLVKQEMQKALTVEQSSTTHEDDQKLIAELTADLDDIEATLSAFTPDTSTKLVDRASDPAPAPSSSQSAGEDVQNYEEDDTASSKNGGKESDENRVSKPEAHRDLTKATKAHDDEAFIRDAAEDMYNMAQKAFRDVQESLMDVQHAPSQGGIPAPKVPIEDCVHIVETRAERITSMTKDVDTRNFSPQTRKFVHDYANRARRLFVLVHAKAWAYHRCLNRVDFDTTHKHFPYIQDIDDNALHREFQIEIQKVLDLIKTGMPMEQAENTVFDSLEG